MKYGSKQHKFLKKLLKINPALTVGQAARRVSILNEIIAMRKELMR